MLTRPGQADRRQQAGARRPHPGRRGVPQPQRRGHRGLARGHHRGLARRPVLRRVERLWQLRQSCRRPALRAAVHARAIPNGDLMTSTCSHQQWLLKTLVRPASRHGLAAGTGSSRVSRRGEEMSRMAEYPANGLVDELSPVCCGLPLDDGIADAEFVVFGNSTDAREGGRPLPGGDPRLPVAPRVSGGREESGDALHADTGCCGFKGSTRC
jgi:hypothetical protein